MVKTKAREGANARITLVLPVEVMQRVKERAAKKATPPSILIRQWIMEELERGEGTQQ